MKVFTCLGRFLLLICFLFPNISVGRDFLETSSITLLKPVDDYAFSLRDYKTFRWSAPVPLIQGNVRYVLKIVEVQNGQTSDFAIANNASFLIDTTASIAANVGHEITISKSIPAKRKMAWQVKAIDDSKTEVAISPVFTFIGPILLEGFYAGECLVTDVVTTSTSMDDITGEALVQVTSNIKHKVRFEHIKVERAGALLVMRRGVLKEKFEGSNVQLTPELSGTGTAEFIPDSIKVEVDWVYLKGVVNWALPALMADNNRTIKTKPDWVKYVKGALLGKVYLADTLRYNSGSSVDLQFETYPNSYFVLYRGNSFYPTLSGRVTVPFANLGKKDSISFAYNNVRDLEYFSLEPITSSKPFQYNEVLGVRANSAILDLSETKSPLAIADPIWKGVYVNTYDLLFNADNTEHDLVGGRIGFKSSITGSRFLLSSGNLEFVADTNFVGGVPSSYNGFSGFLNKISLNRSIQLNKREQIMGTIDIPYIKSDKMHDFYLNFDGVTCTDSLGGYVEDFAFSKKIDKEMLSFSVFDGSKYIPATIDQDQKTIDFVLPQNVDNVICYFSTSGKKVTVNGVNQFRGVTPNSFTAPKDYVVKAADGSINTYKVSRTIPNAITDGILSNRIELYPNPTSDIISVKNITGTAKLSVFSVDGKLVYQELLLVSTKNVSLANLQRGLYVVVIKTEKEIYQTKLLKN